MDSKTASGLARAYSHYIRGRIVLVTGVSPGGLGAAFLKSIAKMDPSELILAGRDRAKVQDTAQILADENPSMKIRLLRLDLSSLETVRKAADTINGWADLRHIDVLVNSAGTMAVDWAMSLDGYESQLATNHLGPFLFTNLIMNKILQSKAPRVVTVGSGCHRLSPFRFADYNFQDGATYNPWQAYGQSKTANSLMALSLAEKLGPTRNLLAFSLHPAYVNSNIDQHIDWSKEWSRIGHVDRFLGNREGWMEGLPIGTIDEGAATYVYAAFDPYLWPHNGSYLENCKVGDPWTNTIKPWVTSSIEAEKVWKLSEQLVGQEFNYS
ncbi:retinol dehydrogenase 13 [Xylariales sp. AK1849]|nr:retinol dehydrogenase 13 [Xylariales sp. AK1849]